jgi:hypothetical protein
MAERDIVSSLFGMTPEMYQQGLARRDTASNLTAAALTPGQLAGYYAMEAGSGLGRAAGSLLGVEDPELMKIKDVQAMKTQFDVSTIDGLKLFAQALAPKYPDLAIQAASEADKRAKIQAETVRALREPGMQSFEKLLSSGKYTPASVGKFKDSQNPADLELIDKGLTGTVLEKVAGAEQNIQTLSAGNTEIDSWLSKVDPKNPQVTFGPVSTLGGGASRIIGYPTDNALEQDKLRRFVSREANAILVAAKGTQTEGDAQRAYDMIISGLDKNSNEGVRGALEDLKDMKSNTVKGLKTYVNTIQNKGKPSTAPTAPSQPSATIKAQADAIRAINPGLTGYTDQQLVELALKQSKR